MLGRRIRLFPRTQKCQRWTYSSVPHSIVQHRPYLPSWPNRQFHDLEHEEEPDQTSECGGFSRWKQGPRPINCMEPFTKWHRPGFPSDHGEVLRFGDSFDRDQIRYWSWTMPNQCRGSRRLQHCATSACYSCKQDDNPFEHTVDSWPGRRLIIFTPRHRPILCIHTVPCRHG